MQTWSIGGDGTIIELSAEAPATDPVPERGYAVGQRVFGRHSATQDYFAGRVVAVDHDDPFPYLVDVGGSEPLHVLASELQSDLPGPGATADDLIEWLSDDADE